MKKILHYFSFIALMMLVFLCFLLVVKNNKENISLEYYTVTFDTNGGTSIDSIQVEKGKSIQKPENPTLENYKFVDWYTDSSYSAIFDFSDPITEDKILYAKWEKESLQGTQAIFNGFEKVDESTYKISIANSKEYLDLNEIVQVGEQSSWSLHPDLTATQIITSKIAYPLTVGDNTFYILVTLNNDVNLYILQIRRRPIYTVSFDSNNEVIIENQNVEEDSKAQKPQDPFKVGYTFTNWNYNFDTPIVSNITITANYVINKYKIMYKLNDDSNDGTINEFFTIEDLEYNLKKPSRENYTFIGWHLDENLLDDRLFTINTIGDKTLFAEWEYGTDGLQYQLAEAYGYYIIVGYIGNSNNVIIPNTHLGADVKMISSLRNSITDENIITELYISSNIWCITADAIRSIANKIESITIEAVDDKWERSYYSDRFYIYDMKQEVDITDSEKVAIYMVGHYNYYLEANNFYNRNRSII